MEEMVKNNVTERLNKLQVTRTTTGVAAEGGTDDDS